LDQELIQKIIARVLAKITGYSLQRMHPKPIPVGVSNRHLHLSATDLETLFGTGYRLQRFRDLRQPGQFAAVETVNIAGPKGCLEKVRVLGPVRNKTQVEISRTDSYKLGLNPPVRESGDLNESCGVSLTGPCGSVYLNEGLIIARRHIHMSPADAGDYGVKDGDNVQVAIAGERSLVFDRTIVRVDPDFRLELHLDTDEANAAGVDGQSLFYLLTAVPQTTPATNSQGNENRLRKNEKSQEVSLITDEAVREAGKNKTKLMATKDTIITPLARDTIKELQVEIIWSDRYE